MIRKGDGERIRPLVGLVMGVAGVGKTTVGRTVAERLGWDFVDGDDFHPPDNVDKMSSGFALTDEDRQHWLDILRKLIDQRLDEERPTVVTCSALKADYRRELLVDADRVRLIYLKAPPEVVRDRIDSRSGHFFGALLVESQYAVLEEPECGITVDATRPFDDVVTEVAQALANL